MKKKFSFTFVFLLLLAGFINLHYAQVTPGPSNYYFMKGAVDTTSTSFEITDSDYLNIVLESSEEVHLFIESLPSMISMMVMPVSNAANAQFELRGLESSKEYHMYQDGYEEHTPFTSDANGVYSFTQDLSDTHHVFIQEMPSTIGLSSSGWSDPTVGTWDPVTRTAILTRDVDQTIWITSSNITLDGNGHKIVGSNSGNGLYLSGYHYQNVKNLEIRNFTYGVYFLHCWHTKLSETIIENNQVGINFGKWMRNDTIRNNSIRNNTNGMRGGYLENCFIYNNNFIDNNVHIPYLHNRTTLFNLPSPIGGNYWSGWTTPDANGDNFVDLPYLFSGGQDNLPWTKENGWLTGTIEGNVVTNSLGMPNVTVKLLDENGLPIEGVDDVITDQTGFFMFENVYQANYQVTLVIPDGYEADQNPILVTVNPNQVHYVEFNLIELKCNISGVLLSDSIGVVGATVKLLDENSQPTQYLDLITDEFGEFNFTEVSSGIYNVTLVEPFGYSVTENPIQLDLEPGVTENVSFEIVEDVICNKAKSPVYWSWQFISHIWGLNWYCESEEELNTYINNVHQYYSAHFSIFNELNSFQDWFSVLKLKIFTSNENKAKRQLAALVLNFVSLKIGQYNVVTEDGKTAGDVLSYVSELLLDNDPQNDKLAKQIARKVNLRRMIDAGIIPESTILYKGFIDKLETNEENPISYELFSNFPNPFNPTTIIRYGVPEKTTVMIDVYNTLGEKVAQLVNQEKTAGYHEVVFNGSNLSSGLYIYKLTAGDFVDIKKMLLLK
jgi:hypothetical protein